MQETEPHSRPVNLWYPQGCAASAGKVSCERFSDPQKARMRAQELIRRGVAVGPVHIEDVETGALVERVSATQ